MNQIFTRKVTELPGGIPFRDPKVPEKKFPGMEVSSVEEQARRVIRWRLQNPTLYPPTDGQWLSVDSVVAEIVAYQRTRLGNDAKYFRDGTVLNGVVLPIVAESAVLCVCGSKDAEPVYCKTCAGKRIIGYQCRACGQKRPR